MSFNGGQIMREMVLKDRRGAVAFSSQANDASRQAPEVVTLQNRAFRLARIEDSDEGTSERAEYREVDSLQLA